MKIKIHVNKERCKGCGICVEVCQTSVLEISEEKNFQGYSFPVVTDPDECISCGLCEMLCPDFAIWIVSYQDEVSS
jgi:2-oxoglutarate ferredoxin oxidoreductase subunit delta